MQVTKLCFCNQICYSDENVIVERGSALVSVTAQTPTAGEAEYRFVATYRCQAQERRVCIAMRTMEGEFGDVLITVVTAGPTKAAKVFMDLITTTTITHYTCISKLWSYMFMLLH